MIIYGGSYVFFDSRRIFLFLFGFTKPLKTIPETENILAKVTQINLDADHDETVLRLSLDAKAVVKLGEFDRGGKTRVNTVAFDHDFDVNGTVTPYGIFGVAE